MANEITLSVALKLEHPMERVNFQSGEVSLTQVGSRSNDAVFAVTTGAAALPIPAGTLGYIVVQNLDPATTSANLVYLYNATNGVSFGRLGYGEFCVLKLGADAQVPAAKVSTTGVNIRVICLEL